MDLFTLANNAAKPSATIPRTSTGHSAPTKTASDTRIRRLGVNLWQNLLQTKATTMVIPDAHRYMLISNAITPSCWCRPSLFLNGGN